jgi:hypothetical protein
MDKSAILTFDYELFLGRKTGTVHNSVIHPTRRILEILKKENARAIFFVDATWLLFLRKNSGSDLKIVEQQLKDIISQGSSVELHLHPQWVNAVNKDGVIYFESFNHYNFLSFSQEEILDTFEASVDILTSITGQKIRCYRAGGFCIEPFEHVRSAFERLNIKYDFSSVPGVYLKSGHIYDYDFRGVPERPYYSFEDDLREPVPGGKFYEFPASTYYNNPFYRLVNLGLLSLDNHKIYGDGSGIQSELSRLSRLKSKNMGFSKTFLTLDQINTRLLSYILYYHFQKTSLMVILSHPKTFSENSANNLLYIIKYFKTLNTDDIERLIIQNPWEKKELK